MLDAIAARAVPAAVIPPNRRALLLADREPATRARARALFGESSPGPRGEAYAKYRPALALPADRARGEPIFERECMSCHRLGPRGHAIGPNLASVQRRTPEEVLHDPMVIAAYLGDVGTAIERSGPRLLSTAAAPPGNDVPG